MPKTPVSKASRYKSWINGDPNFKVENDKLICLLCLKSYSFQKKFEFIQHQSGLQHSARVSRNNAATPKQTLLTSLSGGSTAEQKEFERDLVRTFLEEDIPLDKLEAGPMKKFLTKYCRHPVPSVTSLRRATGDIQQEKIDKVRKEIGDSRVWMSIDEATDAQGRNIAKVVVGKLEGDEETKGLLLYVAEVDKQNASTIVQTVEEALKVLWPVSVKIEKILVLVTDSAAYMLEAGETLKMRYPKLVHTTCLADGLHRVAEEIREQFPDVDNLISNGNKVFQKDPKRVDTFQSLLPTVALPTEPVTTRWLEAALYYAKNYDGFQKVIEALDGDSAEIGEVKELLKSPGLKTKLLYIEQNFSFIPPTIEELQGNSLPLPTAIEKMRKVVHKAGTWLGPEGKNVSLKVDEVLGRNVGWKAYGNISNQLCGQAGELPAGWTIEDAFACRFAPATSAAARL